METVFISDHRSGIFYLVSTYKITYSNINIFGVVDCVIV
jgi:hypothetical protein